MARDLLHVQFQTVRRFSFYLVNDAAADLLIDLGANVSLMTPMGNMMKFAIVSGSESIVKKEKILELMSKYGKASVIERDYKRFKSFEYNKDVEIKEYLFCLQKN